jgi:hypothetical protein
MKVCSFLAVVCLCAASAFAADINGKWKAEMPMGRGGQGKGGGQAKGPMEMIFEFKAEGGKITSCTVSTPRGDQPLSDCKLSGDEVSFSRTMGQGDMTMKVIYKGKVSDTEIRGTMQREGAEGQSREFVAKKVS